MSPKRLVNIWPRCKRVTKLLGGCFRVGVISGGSYIQHTTPKHPHTPCHSSYHRTMHPALLCCCLRYCCTSLCRVRANRGSLLSACLRTAQSAREYEHWLIFLGGGGKWAQRVPERGYVTDQQQTDNTAELGFVTTQGPRFSPFLTLLSVTHPDHV